MGSYSGSKSACRTPMSLPLRQITLAIHYDPYLRINVYFDSRGYFHGG